MTSLPQNALNRPTNPTFISLTLQERVVRTPALFSMVIFVKVHIKRISVFK